MGWSRFFEDVSSEIICPCREAVQQPAGGCAFGLYNAAVGFAALPASLLMGWLWQQFGVEVAFVTGAGLAAAAAGLMLLLI